jgi:hypothetical protein
MFFTDLHVQLLSRGLLNPGEQLLGQTVTSYMPWWAFGFIRRQYLVLATDQRLILVDHRYGFFRPTTQRMHGVDSLAWSNVQEAKITGLFLKKKLKVRGVGERGPIALKMVISNALFGLLAPMSNNMQGARTLAAVAAKSIQGGAPALPAAAPAFGASPPQLQAAGPQGAYGQPPAPYGQPPAPYGQPPAPYGQPPAPFDPGAAFGQPPASFGAPQGAYGQPPMPAVNAPGYHSVPPPAPSPYGAAPVPSPFDPPRQY